MRPITLLIIHCSRTPDSDHLYRASPGTPGSLSPVQVLDRQHQAKGLRRLHADRERFNPDLAAIGYHYLLYRNGDIVTGRAEREVGAHTNGHDEQSLGLCLIGSERFSAAQWDGLKAMAMGLKKSYPSLRIVGPDDLASELLGTSPFDVTAWQSGRMAPMAAHLEERQ